MFFKKFLENIGRTPDFMKGAEQIADAINGWWMGQMITFHSFHFLGVIKDEKKMRQQVLELHNASKSRIYEICDSLGMTRQPISKIWNCPMCEWRLPEHPTEDEVFSFWESVYFEVPEAKRKNGVWPMVPPF